MRSKTRPATPGSDLNNVQGESTSWVPGRVLTKELVDFVQSGISVNLAAVSRQGRPLVGIGLACTVDQEGGMRILLRAPANAELLEAIKASSAVAVTFARPADHRSIQFKAAHATIHPIVPADTIAASKQGAGMRNELVAVDHSDDFASSYVDFRPDELVAVYLVPQQAFVQTPGVGAGTELPGAKRG
jgi:hypothetical protein